ncbi:hypothetical protein PS2_034240 [Malus domestica]
MKSDKVDSAAKVAPRPIPHATKTNLHVGKKEIARVGSYEKSTKPASWKATEIYALLKPDMLENIDKTAILAVESMLFDQKDTKAAKDMVKAMAMETYSSAENIKRLKSELIALKGFNISAPTSLQLEIACKEIVDLKTRLDAI